MRDIEALVKGLTQELLDLKSLAMKMYKQTEERRMQDFKRVQPVVQSGQQPAAAPGSASGDFKHGCDAEGLQTARCSCSPSGTCNGYDHAA